MNITSLTGTNTTNALVLALDLAQEIIINSSRILSIIGIFVNLFGLLVLRNERLVEKFYGCLFCRCVCNLVVCLFGSIHYKRVLMESPMNYSLALYHAYFYFPLTRIAFMASINCDMLLILNRLVLLFGKKKNLFFILSKKVNYICALKSISMNICQIKQINLFFNPKANLLICYLIPTIFSIPYFFGIEVVKVSDSSAVMEGSFVWLNSEFGEQKTYKLYTVAALVFGNLIPTLVLIILNTISLIKFRQMLSNMADTSFLRSVRTNIVRLVLVLTFVCIFVRVFDLLSAFPLWFESLLQIESEEMNSLLNLVRQIAFFCLFSAHALDGIFCYFYDRLIKQVACQLVRKPLRKSSDFFSEMCYNFV